MGRVGDFLQDKIVDYKEVMENIPDKALIATASFGFGGTPEQLMLGLHEHFKEKQAPKHISFMTTAGIGTFPEKTGLDLLNYPDFLECFYGSHLLGSPNASQAAQQNEYAAYLLPQGIIGQMYQDAARKGPGVISRIGLDTFIDPRVKGGKMNALADEKGDIVQLVEIHDEEWLHYQPVKIDVAFIKATYADHRGNLSFKHETNELEFLSIAIATHNNGGIVIAQVEEVVEDFSLPAKEVKIPGKLVDFVVKAAPENHRQLLSHQYHPGLSQEIRVDLSTFKQMPESIIKKMAQRINQEIADGDCVNIGYGFASQIAQYFLDEDRLEKIHLTTDLGAYGGLPASGYSYGSNWNAEAIISTADMMSLYQSGGLDVTIIGFGLVDQLGNVDTVDMGDKFAGPGGMIDITTGADKIIFVGNFVLSGQAELVDNALKITKEGKGPKFVEELKYTTFNAKQALSLGKEILIITERAIFDVVPEGLRLIEYAPGLNVEKDIIAKMAFRPIIANHLKQMDWKDSYTQ